MWGVWSKYARGSVTERGNFMAVMVKKALKCKKIAVTTKSKKLLPKDKRVKSEITKIKKILKGLEPEKLKSIESLIQNAAWMAITLNDLRSKIDLEGPVEKYKNGANQYGQKESAAIKVYNATIKNYTVVIKQLLDQLPDGSVEKEDGFDEFLKEK